MTQRQAWMPVSGLYMTCTMFCLSTVHKCLLLCSCTDVADVAQHSGGPFTSARPLNTNNPQGVVSSNADMICRDGVTQELYRHAVLWPVRILSVSC